MEKLEIIQILDTLEEEHKHDALNAIRCVARFLKERKAKLEYDKLCATQDTFDEHGLPSSMAYHIVKMKVKEVSSRVLASNALLIPIMPSIEADKNVLNKFGELSLEILTSYYDETYGKVKRT